MTIYEHQHQVNNTGGNGHDSSKVVILAFGDTHKSQFTVTKPTLLLALTQTIKIKHII